MIRGGRVMRYLCVNKLCREPIVGFAHRQEKRSLTPFSHFFLICAPRRHHRTRPPARRLQRVVRLADSVGTYFGL